MNSTVEKFLYIFLVLLIVMVFYLTAMFGYQAYHYPICLQNGYSRVEATYNFEVYCIDKNEVVIPIGEIE